MSKVKRLLFFVAGIFALLLGGVGIVANFFPFIPFPTTPFLLLASFCFSRSSKRFEVWFENTKVYEKYLADFVQDRSMTFKQKRNILAFASGSLILSFILVNRWWVRAILIVAFITKYLYFYFLIETIPEEKSHLGKKQVVNCEDVA